MSRSSHSLDEPQLTLPLLDGAAEHALGRYFEGDDVATQFRDTPPPDPDWIVQVSRFDRRVMSRQSLVEELERGSLPPSDTLVWRGGMLDWSPAALVDELGFHPEFPANSVRHTVPMGLPMGFSPVGATACVILAASISFGVTLLALAAAGTFENSARALAGERESASAQR
jgi:hypothetical protein